MLRRMQRINRVVYLSRDSVHVTEAERRCGHEGLGVRFESFAHPLDFDWANRRQTDLIVVGLDSYAGDWLSDERQYITCKASAGAGRLWFHTYAVADSTRIWNYRTFRTLSQVFERLRRVPATVRHPHIVAMQRAAQAA